jgi:hypothetical protein
MVEYLTMQRTSYTNTSPGVRDNAQNPLHSWTVAHIGTMSRRATETDLCGNPATMYALDGGPGPNAICED